MVTVGPLTNAEFSHAIERLGPFENRPRIAVAVSGGADSLSLALFASAWARRRGGAATALTVDHGLRPDAAAEARLVGRWLRARGIDHHILAWRGIKPHSNLQAIARTARYRLLSDWCARHGVLHLLLAHHTDDQAETHLLRLARGSGVDGLAAMAPVHELPALRVLRPLLGVPRARLEAALRAAGQDWVDDPTNRDRAHARVRMRQLLPALAEEGLTAARLTATTRRLAHARAAIEAAVATLLAEATQMHPTGYCRLDRERLTAAPTEIGLRALARILRTVGGTTYPARLERLERLFGELAGGNAPGRTLAGCQVLPWRDAYLVCREAALARGEVPLGSGRAVIWDDRFAVSAAGQLGRSMVVRSLGPHGWGGIAEDLPGPPRFAVPVPVRASLPAIWDRKGLLAVPHAGFVRRGRAGRLRLRCQFAPCEPLAGAPFAVV